MSYTGVSPTSMNLTGTTAYDFGSGPNTDSGDTAAAFMAKTADNLGAIDGVISAILTAMGVAQSDVDLGTFSGGTIPDNANVKAAIQALETALEAQSVTGQFLGSAATFAALPTGADASNGDWAALTADDGVNSAGAYVYDGTNFAFAFTFGDTVANMVGSDGTNAGSAGLVPAPAATDDTKFLRGDGTWQPVSSTAVRIDASTSTVTQTLAASLDAGTVIPFTNIDVTNTATLAVQTGETLNGVTDGTFLFSNYPAGTQFRADEVTGGWVVSVVGASTSKTLGRFTYEIDNGTTDLVNHTAAGDGSYGQSDIVPLNAANVTRAGTFDVVGNTLVCNTAGEYEVKAEFLLFDSGGADSTSIYAYVGDGTSQIGFVAHERAGLSLYANASKTFTREFQVGDALDFRIATPSTEDASCRGLLVDIREVPTKETVLAGMVESKDLHIFSTTRQIISTANMNSSPLFFSGDPVVAGQDRTYDPQGMFSNNVVTIQQDGLYEIFASANNQDYQASLYILVDGADLVRIMTNSGSTAGQHTSMAGKTYIELSAGQTVSLRGQGFSTGNGVTFSVQQVATKGVINSTDVPVNDQATSGYMDIGDMRIAWGMTGHQTTHTITFPAGGFAQTPSLTVSVLAASADTQGVTISSINKTSATIVGEYFSTPKHWQAIGRKP